MTFLQNNNLKFFGSFFLFVLILFALVVWFNYWKVQLMYNSSLLSLYTPDSFSISTQQQKSHEYYTLKGTDEMQNKTIVICSLIRDVAERLPEIRKRSERLGESFADYRILIVENDSSDETRKLLKKWRRQNSKLIILGCGVNSDKDKCHLELAKNKTEGHGVDRNRIEKMTYLRNIYLEYVKSKLYYFDYCAVWDMDIVGTIYLDGVANTIGHFISNSSPAYNSDAICSYGIYRWGFLTLYYDTYAHIDKDDSFHIDLKTIHDLKKGFGKQYNRGVLPQRVVSCFSGFTIYQIKSLIHSEIYHDMSPLDNLECEHVRLNKKLDKVYLNPSMIHFVLFNK